MYLGVGSPPSHRLVYRLLSDDKIQFVELIAVERRDGAYVCQLASHRLGRLQDETRKAFNMLHQRIISVRGARRNRKG